MSGTPLVDAGVPKKRNWAIIGGVVVVVLVLAGLVGYLIYSLIGKSNTTPPPPTNEQPANQDVAASNRREVMPPPPPPPPAAREDPYAGVATDFQMGNNGKKAQVMDHGCWKDNPSDRIMRESNQYGWEWKGCIWQAAKQNRNMCGMQAGGQCWIPYDNLMVPKTVIDRSHLKMDRPGECGPGGASYSMHVYSWDDDAKAIIANGDNPGV